MEKHKISKIALVAVFAIIAFAVLSGITSVARAISVPSGIVVTPHSVAQCSLGVVRPELKVCPQTTGGADRGKLKFKLFGLIPIKTIDILCSREREVRIGGFPIGLALNVDGVLVDEIGSVDTVAGKVTIGDEIESGDIILALDGKKVVTLKDFNECMDGFDGTRKLCVTLNRKGRIREVSVSPPIDALTGKFRLGLWVRDNVSGIGTTSFVKSDNSFAALGHGISSRDYVIPTIGGKAYDCEIVGINKGEKGAPGELKGVLKNTDKPIGEVFRNTDYGVFGRYNPGVELPDRRYKIGSRLNVRNGKAQICTSLDGVTDFYDIEIIRCMPQTVRAERSMVVRVTDKRLLNASGGIVRGMSGSPIIQNDMIVGALTHVFVNDPTKGYGIYLDWMY